MHDDGQVTVERREDSYQVYNDRDYSSGNYFQKDEQAQYAGDEFQKVLFRQAGRLGDFHWAVSQMKQNKKVRRCEWVPQLFMKVEDYMLREFPEPSFVVFSDKYRFHCPNIQEVEATDWELFEDKIGETKCQIS